MRLRGCVKKHKPTIKFPLSLRWCLSDHGFQPMFLDRFYTLPQPAKPSISGRKSNRRPPVGRPADREPKNYSRLDYFLYWNDNDNRPRPPFGCFRTRLVPRSPLYMGVAAALGTALMIAKSSSSKATDQQVEKSGHSPFWKVVWFELIHPAIRVT